MLLYNLYWHGIYQIPHWHADWKYVPAINDNNKKNLDPSWLNAINAIVLPLLRQTQKFWSTTNEALLGGPGGAWLPAPFKIDPSSPGSLNRFFCPLNYFCSPPAPSCTFGLLFCSLLHRPFPLLPVSKLVPLLPRCFHTMLPALWLFCLPFSQLPKNPCRVSQIGSQLPSPCKKS